MKVKEIIKLLENDGWYLVAQRDSHRQFNNHHTSLSLLPDYPRRTYTRSLNNLTKNGQ